jgi:hypothetical protein
LKSNPLPTKKAFLFLQIQSTENIFLVFACDCFVVREDEGRMADVVRVEKKMLRFESQHCYAWRARELDGSKLFLLKNNLKQNKNQNQNPKHKQRVNLVVSQWKHFLHFGGPQMLSGVAANPPRATRARIHFLGIQIHILCFVGFSQQSIPKTNAFVKSPFFSDFFTV